MDLGNLIFMSNNCNRPSGSEGGAASIRFRSAAKSRAERGGVGGSLSPPPHNQVSTYLLAFFKNASC